MSTPILPFAVWASGTNQASIPANDNSLRNQILNGLVIADDVTAQPGSPSDSDIYILAATHTGSQWASFDEDDLVIFMDGTWYAFAPVEGVVVNLDGTLRQFISGAWADAGGGGGSGTPGGADTQVQFNDGGSFGGEAEFAYDKTNNILNVRRINLGPVNGDDNGVSGDDPHWLNISNDPSVVAGGASAGLQLLRINSYGSAGYGGNVHFCRYRGSKASPTAVQNNDTFMSFGMRGWDSSGALGASSGSWGYRATENHTGSAHGGEFFFGCTANGSTTRTERVKIGSYGIDVVSGDIVASGGGAIKNGEPIIICASDETTAITAASGKVTFRMPYAFTLTGIRASLSTAQSSGSIFTVDVNENGSSILSTKITIDNGEKTSTTAATAPVLSDTSLADDAEITIDVDQIGDGTAKGLKVTLLGRKT